MAHASGPSILPLLVWREQDEIGRIQILREALCERIDTLRPHSHRRIELQAQLRELTVRQLELERKLGGAS
ncbi:MAG: hypothetical protein WCY29_13665 [Novosphingobium sp.]